VGRSSARGLRPLKRCAVFAPSFFVVSPTGGLGFGALDVRSPAAPDKTLIDMYLVVAPAAIKAKNFHRAFRLDVRHVAIQNQLDAVAHHLLIDQFGGVPILFRKDLAVVAKQGYIGPEAGKRLSQFAADRAGADDGQPPR